MISFYSKFNSILKWVNKKGECLNKDYLEDFLIGLFILKNFGYNQVLFKMEYFFYFVKNKLNPEKEIIPSFETRIFTIVEFASLNNKFNTTCYNNYLFSFLRKYYSYEKEKCFHWKCKRFDFFM